MAPDDPPPPTRSCRPLGPMARAYNASTFEEERRLVIDNGRFLAQFDWDQSPKVGPRTLELAVDFPVQFAEASVELRDDREAALAAVSVEGDLLMQCSEALRNDVGVVLAAVRREGRAWKYASTSLRSDRGTVLEAVRRSRYALQYASEALRSDKEVVLAAVEGDSLALVWADEAFKSDRDVLVKALQKQAKEPRRIFNVLKYASPELKRDKGLVLLAVRGASFEVAARFDYDQASYDLRQRLSWEDFAAAAKSSIAVAGEDAPVLQIALTDAPTTEHGGSSGGSDQRNFSCSVTLLSGRTFTCNMPEALSVTGLGPRILAWYWPFIGRWRSSKHSSIGPESRRGSHLDLAGPEGDSGRQDVPSKLATTSREPGAHDLTTVNDLAKKLIEELPRHAEVCRSERVFLVLNQPDGSSTALTPWEWNVPLVNLLPRSS